MRGNVQLLRQNLAVTGSLIQHIHEIRVLKDVLHLTAGKQIFDVLRDAGGNAAPFTEALPNLHGVSGGLLLLQQKVKLIHIVASGLTCAAVGRHAAPHLVLHDEHADLLQLFAKLLDVIADKAVVDVYVGPVIEQIQRAFDVDFKRRCHTVRFLFLLLQKRMVKILQQRHIFRLRILKVVLIDLMHTTVDDRLFNGLQALLAADDQLAKRKNEISLQRQRIVILRVGLVDIHGVDIVGAGRADLNDLTFQTVDQRGILRLGIADDDIIIGDQKGVGDLTFCGEGLAGAGRTEDQPVRVLQLLSVYHDQVVGESVQPVIQGFIAVLEQLLRGKGDEDRRGAGGQRPLDLDQVIRKREAAHQALLLLEVQPSQVAVVLLGDGAGLKHIVFKLLLRPAGVHDEKGNQEHALVLRLQLLQKSLRILAVGSQIRRDDVHVIPGTDGLLLLLDLAAVKLGDGVLDLLDGGGLVH